MGNWRDDESASVFKTDEASIKQVINAWRQE
jgi:hypothetical protein